MTAARVAPGPKTAAEFTAFAKAIDDVADKARKDLGMKDARYVRQLLAAIRITESAGRALLTFSGWFWPAWCLGAALLGLSKCLENMELGHNVIHGQYDWLNDPRFVGKTYEWDTTCSKEDWRFTHNHMHHTYTNVLGVDRDLGYGMWRLTSDEPWERRHLIQAPYAIIVGFLFEWAIAIHNMEFEQLKINRAAAKERIHALWPVTRAKMWRQIKKDYLLWPLLGGVAGWLMGTGFVTGALASLAGHVVANLIRNVWTFATIFCGHFTDQVHAFDPADLKNESRGQWYLRQALGSANINGGRLFHLLTGHLSHQIEHHLFPDIPAWRYGQMALEVQRIFKQYDVPYNNGAMARQFATVAWRITRHSFPGGKGLLTAMPASGKVTNA